MIFGFKFGFGPFLNEFEYKESTHTCEHVIMCTSTLLVTSILMVSSLMYFRCRIFSVQCHIITQNTLNSNFSEGGPHLQTGSCPHCTTLGGIYSHSGTTNQHTTDLFHSILLCILMQCMSNTFVTFWGDGPLETCTAVNCKD